MAGWPDAVLLFADFPVALCLPLEWKLWLMATPILFLFQGDSGPTAELHHCRLCGDRGGVHTPHTSFAAADEAPGGTGHGAAACSGAGSDGTCDQV